MTTEITQTTNAAVVPLKERLGAIKLSDKGEVQIRDMAEGYVLAELLVRTGWAPKGTTAEGAVVSIMAGAAVGLSPIQAVQNIASINGRPSLYGDGLMAVCSASGKMADYRVERIGEGEGDKAGIRVTVKRTDRESETSATFTVADAKRAGLWGKSGPWSQYPARMLLARARAYALRDAFADVLHGIGSAEEQHDIMVSEIARKPETLRDVLFGAEAEAVEAEETHASVDPYAPTAAETETI